MRIDLNTNAGAVADSHIEKASPSTAAAQSNSTKSNSTAVAESDASVGQLAAKAMSAPEVRSEKVHVLQSQLQSGTYHVSSTEVAASMLEQMRARA